MSTLEQEIQTNVALSFEDPMKKKKQYSATQDVQTWMLGAFNGSMLRCNKFATWSIGTNIVKQLLVYQSAFLASINISNNE